MAAECFAHEVNILKTKISSKHKLETQF